VVTTHVLDPARLRRVFGAFPTGVTAVAAMAGDEPIGLTANSFTSVSLEPALVSVCIARTSRTWSRLSLASRLGVSILSAEQEHVGRQLATRRERRFDGLDWRVTEDGAVLLDGASGWIEASIVQQVEAGDHHIVVLAVHDLDADHDLRPLVFHGGEYRHLPRLTPRHGELAGPAPGPRWRGGRGSRRDSEGQDRGAPAGRVTGRVLARRPRWLAVLGGTAYRAAFTRPDAAVGLQEDTIGSARLWILPHPSGLNAHYPPRGPRRRVCPAAGRRGSA
jgi:flavin reductase (DIM6/NTAB) family NADH-FMN oxidoreductase RutF